ncbi:MAG: hypothetical protein OEY09_19100 [Gammaproteobacteria bacterium]|nr:hypothetical protein [Gammaproteobacteria bacterium]
MHIILIAIIVLLLIYIFIVSQKTSSQSYSEPAETLIKNSSSDTNHEFIFISRGKLFLNNTSNQLEEIHSPYVQEMIDRMNRKKQLHGWKQNTSLSTSFVGQNDISANDQVGLQVVGAQFCPDNKLIYFMKDSNVGGLFKYDATTKTEHRLLHQQNLYYENLAVNPDSGKILCSDHHENGTADVTILNDDGHGSEQLTEGDTVDSSPAWIPGDVSSILYQSSGLARSEEGYVIAHGPSAIKMLNLDNNEVVSVLEDVNFDFLQPRVDRQGNLYFIKRPYEAQQYGGSNLILDTLLFPFRLLRALFHYLNFFSLMYSRKPLTSASGPKVEADLKDILIKGKRIDAEKALRTESRINGIPSLVPKSWQLIKRTQKGAETVLATNVASFDLTSDDTILYSNGYAVFQMAQNNQSQVILRDKLIADVIAS